MNSDQLVVNSDIDVKGKVGEAEETTFKEGTEYTLTITNAEGKSGFTIAFATDKIAAYAGGTITITYTAKLQDGASVGAVGNVNSADLKYSRRQILPLLKRILRMISMTKLLFIRSRLAS